VQGLSADELIVRAVRTLQIMVGGMIFGAIFFLLVALVTFGRQGNTRLSADAASGAKLILTYEHVPVGTRVVIGAGGPNEEVRVVVQAEPIEGEEQQKLRLDAPLAADHRKGESIRRYQPERRPDLAYLLLAVTAAPLALWALLPGATARRARNKLTGYEDRRHRNEDTAMLALALQTRTLIAAALIESAVFLNIVGYLVSQMVVSAVVAAGLIVVLLGHFPTCQRAARWIETQRAMATKTNA
jgi:hypothetical protein